MSALKIGLPLCVALASSPAHASPLAIDVALAVDIRGIVAAADQDMHRQGYVTAYRSAAMRSAMQGLGRPRAQALLAFVGNLNPQLLHGWTINTAAATSGVFASLASGMIPSTRSDAPAGATSTLNSIFNVGELGRLDDGRRAVQRVIEGARVFSDSDDPDGMLFGTR